MVLCVMIIITKNPRASNPFDLLCLKSVRRETSGRGKGNGGALRNLVIIVTSFFLIPKPKECGVDGASEAAAVGEGNGITVLERE